MNAWKRARTGDRQSGTCPADSLQRTQHLSRPSPESGCVVANVVVNVVVVAGRVWICTVQCHMFIHVLKYTFEVMHVMGS